MIFVGIDPGLHGAIALIEGRHANVLDMPVLKGAGTKGRDVFNLPEMSRILNALVQAPAGRATVHATLEKQSTRPQQSTQSGFACGRSSGLWEMGLTVLGIAYEVIEPKAWRRSFGLAAMPAKESKALKAANAAKAAALYPRVELYGPQGGLRDGRADALLLAEYGRRLYVQTG